MSFPRKRESREPLRLRQRPYWIPAFAGMTKRFRSLREALDRLHLRDEVAPPGRSSAQNAGFVNDFGDVFFLAVSHDMDARNALRFAQGLDHLDADALAFGLLVLGAFEALDDAF